MAFKHTNPSRARRNEREGKEHWARAPYNFVPLPERVVQAAADGDALPSFDRYDVDAYPYTGWIDCTLETCSPTYVRGMLTAEEHAGLGKTSPDQLTAEQKADRAPFFSVDGATPVIPGSSLRGMLRNLVEIAGFGKMRWVTEEDRFFFRAVAAPESDPLSVPYKSRLRQVRAGYLMHQGNEWFIQPAKGAGENFLKVRETDVDAKLKVPGLNDARYQPQYHEISYTEVLLAPSRGNPKGRTVAGAVGEPRAYPHSGWLVCTGNMLEAGRRFGGTTKRKNHWVIPAKDTGATRLKISKEAVEAYEASATAFQRERPFDPQHGCLVEGRPVFFCQPASGDVIYFGHTRNFRIPAWSEEHKRPVTPHDLVPAELRRYHDIDLAEAMFGWTPENASDRSSSRAGRLQIGDATLASAPEGLWYSENPITPHVLSGPKPTTFQHYLTQDLAQGHDPDDRKQLAHYGSPLGSTSIRGHKLYWHNGPDPRIEADSKERDHESQLTRIKPLKAGVTLRFRVRFENLSVIELGALLWALRLPGEDGKQYRHKIGMGKPLGMGAVAITASDPVLHDRRDRYARLFTGGLAWHVGAARSGVDFVAAFRQHVSAQVPDAFAEQGRVAALLRLVEWPGPNVEWTRYMQIEHPTQGNEYKERPVLPDPFYAEDTEAAVKARPPYRPSIQETAPTVQRPGRMDTRPSQPDRGSTPRRETASVEVVPTKPPETSPTWVAAQTAIKPAEPKLPAVGDTVRGTVMDVEPSGTVWVDLGRREGQEVMAVIRPPNLMGKHYQVDQSARLEVVEIKQDGSGWLVEAKPSDKKKPAKRNTGAIA